jgi:hypothetical protein
VDGHRPTNALVRITWNCQSCAETNWNWWLSSEFSVVEGRTARPLTRKTFITSSPRLPTVGPEKSVTGASPAQQRFRAGADFGDTMLIEAARSGSSGSTEKADAWGSARWRLLPVLHLLQLLLFTRLEPNRLERLAVLDALGQVRAQGIHELLASRNAFDTLFHARARHL